MGSLPAWPYQWILIGLGAVLWVAGTTVIRRQDAFKGSPVGRALLILGVAAAGFGIYAGFKGPITVGPLTVPTFSFAHAVSDSQKQAFAYVKSGKVHVSRRPAPAWRGVSDKALEYTVVNNGNEGLSWLRLSFSTGRSALERKLSGPFPARKTTKVVVKVPKTVDRSYFQAVSSVEYGHITGASF
jgi:hypothetical protein